MNLVDCQYVESFKQELEETLSTQQQASKLERKQGECCESEASSQFNKTNCTCLSFPESKFTMIETEVEYLRQQIDYPFLPVHVEFIKLKKHESEDRLFLMPFYVCASKSCFDRYPMRLVVYRYTPKELTKAPIPTCLCTFIL